MKSKIHIIKFGGSLLSDDKARKEFLKQAARLSRLRSLVLVHGGGPEINAALEKMGIPPRFVNGRRVTDDESLSVVEGVLSGRVNKNLVGELSRLKVNAVGISGRDGNLITAKAVPELGRVGEPWKSDGKLVEVLVGAGYVPVVSSVASDGKGGALNVNADEAAAALAVSLKAEKLIYMTDTAGVWDKDKKTIPVIKTRDIDELIKSGVISGGMIPKVKSCRAALEKGVGEIDIIDGRAGLLKMKGTRFIE